MKKEFFAVVVALVSVLCAPARASDYAGKLDLTGNPEAIVLREFNDGMWLVGAQKTAWKLVNIRKDVEVFHVAAFYATRLEGQSPAYGPAVGFNFGPAMAAALSRVEVLVPLIPEKFPPWVSKLGEWTSIDAYAGYRPSVAADQHHIVYGLGGKVKIPLDLLSKWAAGSWSSNNTAANKGL